eukprot:358065-Chlamydomonas_euryale.AAC.7
MQELDVGCQQPGLHRACMLGVSSLLYVRICSTLCTVADEALRLPPLVLRVPLHHICPARCGFHTMDRAPLQQVSATAYKRSRFDLGIKLVCTCAMKASQGRHKDTIPWRWREDEEDQQVEEEGEELPDQEKQPVLEEAAAAASKAAAAATVI